jgi:hypothetical protein
MTITSAPSVDVIAVGGPLDVDDLFFDAPEMPNTAVFYRVHRRDALFSADEAWSQAIDGDSEEERGYSAFATARELLDYVASNQYPDLTNDVMNRDVIKFSGDVVGTGVDGELLVVPYEEVAPERITWEEFYARADTFPHCVRIWRAVPETVTAFRPGDYVVKDSNYAAQHRDAMQDWTGKSWHVISVEVPEHHVRWAGKWNPETETGDEWEASCPGNRRELRYQPSYSSAGGGQDE